MKNCIVVLLLVFQGLVASTQHTFSIVAVDSITGEIGSAGATCLSFEGGAIEISDIILNVGAIHTQAWWTIVNQRAARVRMEAGETPQEIIDWLISNDNPSQGGNIADRQYGVVDLNNGHPRSAAHTGTNNWDSKGHRVGPGYSIQGNILISEAVLDDMESAYLTTMGTLDEKLMAAMQAAKRPGADERCLAQGISSGSAFIRVAQPTDTNSAYGMLWLDLNAWLDSGTFSGDPIDELQLLYDSFKATSITVEHTETSKIRFFPNPSSGRLYIESKELIKGTLLLYDLLGRLKHHVHVNPNQKHIDLTEVAEGLYTLNFISEEGNMRHASIVTLH